MAFELFRRAHVKAAVIEVGLGGRFDATNVLTPPVSAIHIDRAGSRSSTWATPSGEIAVEKAGIIKPGMLLVTGALPEAASRVVGRDRAGAGSPARRGNRWCARRQRDARWTSAADDRDAARTLRPPAARLAGSTRYTTRLLLFAWSKQRATPASMSPMPRWWKVSKPSNGPPASSCSR